MAKKTVSAIILVSVLLAGCASPTAGPTTPPSQAAVEPTPTAVPTAPAPTATPTQPATATSTFTPTTTPTPEPTNTPSPVPRYSLSGTVFHDMNGNGTRDTAYGIDEANYSGSGWRNMTSVSEPVIQGATVRIGDYVATTDENGWFSLIVPAGDYRMAIAKEGFRFYLESDSRMVKLDTGIALTISGETSRDFGIGIGCFTLPYKTSDFGCVFLLGYTDIDPTPNRTGRYNMEDDRFHDWQSMTAGTGDGHRGIDYWVAAAGAAVVAMAPGMIYSTGAADDGMLMIVIVHTDYEQVEAFTGATIDWAPVGLQSSYQHLGSYAQGIEPGAWVKRGQVIATIGEHPAPGFDHLHAEAADCSYKHLTGNWLPYVDLFRDTLRDRLSFPAHEACWEGGCYPVHISQGSPGYWTADNQPQFSTEPTD